jgi:cytidylate kinase
MENLLFQYMQNRFLEMQRNQPGESAPFVTISRDFGCPAKIIAQMLAEKLNDRAGKGNTQKWISVSKEILEESAKKLELEPGKLKHIFSAVEKGVIDDVLASFSSNYNSSIRIKKTIRDVIRSIAMKGHVIIVGRGGVAITHGYPGSLHVRLQAPIEWRIREVASHFNVPETEAQKMISETDKKRTALIGIFLGHEPENSLFDLILNCKTLTKENIVSTILSTMEQNRMA